MNTQFKQNLLAAYNEAINNNRMTELVARQHITNKYGVAFINFDSAKERYTDLVEHGANEYKGFMLESKLDSQSVLIYKGTKLVKCIAGNVWSNEFGLLNDGVEKAMRFIDNNF